MTEATVLQFPTRKVLDEEEDFVEEVAHQLGLGKHVARQVRKVLSGDPVFVGVTLEQVGKVRILAEKRGIILPNSREAVFR